MMTYDVAVSTLASVLGHGIWAGAAILAATLLILRLLDRRGTNAATRHTIYMVALLGMLAVHVFLAMSYAPLAAEQPVLTRSAPGEFSEHQTWPPATSFARDANRRDGVVPGPGTAGHVSPTAFPEPVRVKTAPTTLALPRMLAPMILLLGVIWLLGAILALGRLALAVIAVGRLKHDATPLSQSVHRRVLSHGTGGRRNVALAACAVVSPVAAGLGRPMVLVPHGFLESTDPETFDQLALHEVAHLARRDDLAMLVQRLIEAVLWFHPAVRWVGSRLLAEREGACDEWVVSATRAPRAYARSLKRLIDMRLTAAGLAAAPGLAARENDLLRRIRRLLSQGSLVSSNLRSDQIAVGIALVALVVAVSVVQAPRFQLFGQQAPPLPVRGVDAPPLPSMPSLPPLPSLPSLPPMPSLAPKPAIAPGAVSAPLSLAPEGAVSAPSPAAGIAPAAPLAEPVQMEVLRPGVSAPVPVASPPLGKAAVSSPENPPDLTAAGWMKLFAVARGIPSDGDLAQVLLEAAPRLPRDGRVHRAYLDAASRIRSSGESVRVLLALLQTGPELDAETVTEVVHRASAIPSSGDKVRVLLAIIDQAPKSQGVRQALIDAAGSVPSSGDRERVLSALLNQN